MQYLDINLRPLLKEKIERLESQFKEFVLAEGAGHLFICPFCNYSSNKNRKGSAKCFDTDSELVFKCFNCGKWRKV